MTSDAEVHYRDALASVRAIVAQDDVAASVIARYATGTLLADITGVCLYLLTANVSDPLRAIDRLFTTVPETLAAAEAYRRLNDGDAAK